MDDQPSQAKLERDRIIRRLNELSAQFGRSSCLSDEWQECVEYCIEQIEKMGVQ